MVALEVLADEKKPWANTGADLNCIEGADVVEPCLIKPVSVRGCSRSRVLYLSDSSFLMPSRSGEDRQA